MPQHIQLYKSSDTLNQLPVSLDLTQPLISPVDSSWQVSNSSWMYFDLDAAIQRTSFVAGNQSANDSLIHYVPSLFEKSVWKALCFNPILVENNKVLSIFLGILLIISLTLIVIIKLNTANKISQLITSSFRPNNFRRFVEEYQPGWGPLVFTAYLLSSLIISAVIISRVFPFLGYSDGLKIGISSSLMLAIIFIPLLRSLIIAVWGWIFSTRQLAMFHVQFSYVTQLFVAIFLTPFFLNDALKLGLETWLHPLMIGVGLGGIWLYQLIRIWMHGNPNGLFSVFYLFVYLCTLEIVPLLLIIRLISIIAKVE
ncbi:MAG: DUF4271 domain-containing protein [Flavobacteriales bacterium]|nr:DUF4271 domain-containing protein [Flavobacteriales bacterium]